MRKDIATVDAIADILSLSTIQYFLCNISKELRLVGRSYAKLRYKAEIVARVVASCGLYKHVNSPRPQILSYHTVQKPRKSRVTDLGLQHDLETLIKQHGGQ